MSRGRWAGGGAGGAAPSARWRPTSARRRPRPGAACDCGHAARPHPTTSSGARYLGAPLLGCARPGLLDRSLHESTCLVLGVWVPTAGTGRATDSTTWLARSVAWRPMGMRQPVGSELVTHAVKWVEPTVLPRAPGPPRPASVSTRARGRLGSPTAPGLRAFQRTALPSRAPSSPIRLARLRRRRLFGRDRCRRRTDTAFT